MRPLGFAGDVAVRARGLAKRYDGIVAVDGVDFDVRTAQCFGFLGPNGAGKSTTIKLLTGILVPTSGSAFVNGEADLVLDARDPFCMGIRP